MSNLGPLLKIVEEITNALEPLIAAAEKDPQPSGIYELLKDLGWDLEVMINNSGDLVDFAVNIINVWNTLQTALDDPLKIFELMIELADLISSIETLSSLSITIPPEFVDLFQELPLQLVDYLIIMYLQGNYPLLHNVLVLIGIIETSQKHPLPPRVPYTSWKMNWGNIPRLFYEPHLVLKETYHWDDPNFDPQKLFLNIRNILWLLSVAAYFQHDDDDGLRTLDSSTDLSDILRIPIYTYEDAGVIAEIGAALLGLKESNPHYAGVALAPYAFGNVTAPFDLGGGWTLSFGLSADTGSPFGIKIIAPLNISAGLLTTSGNNPKLGVEVGISKGSDSGTKIIVMGKANESRFEASAFGLNFKFSVGQSSDPEFSTEAYITNAAIVIKGGEGDGFINKILPPDGIIAPFDFKIGISSVEGLYFEGSVGLEVTLPIHQNLGPLELKTIYLKASINTFGNVEFLLATSLGIKLGPFSGVVDRIGLKIESEIKAKQKTEIKFLPPLGVGFSVNTSGLVGGGFLELDYDNERYSGILQLTYGKIGLIAITVITTRFPDGSKGFSMIGIISIKIDPPISLPYNFYFHGGGGLFGINRSMNLDIIAQRLKDGILSNIFFPSGDVIARAPEIIADIRDVFPPVPDRYVFGVMVSLSWSQVIFGNVGVILEVPMPIKFAFVGQLYTYLPTEDAAIIELHLDILGALDLEKQKLFFMVSLYDSRLLILELYGDAYIGICWFPGNSYFVMSLGGFHPNDKSVPTDIPSLRRLTVSLSRSENLKITIQTYFALTPKTLAFGCNLDLFAGSGDFSVVGYFGFDALFIFSPFSFETSFSAGAAIKMGGSTLLSLRLQLNLNGPAPWHVDGKASFKILFIEASVSVSKTWGESKRDLLTNYDPMDDLVAALEESKNWGAVSTFDETPISTTDAGSDTPVDLPIVVPPNGALEIDQNIVPLNTTITKYKNETPVGNEVKYRIKKVYIDSTGVELSNSNIDNYFSRPQFQKLSNSEKLSLPQFELMNSGMKTMDNNINLLSKVEYLLEFENEVIDENQITHHLGPTLLLYRLGSKILLGGRLALNSQIKLNTIKPVLSLTDQKFSVVYSNNLTQVAGLEGNLTHTQASEVLAIYESNNSNQVGLAKIVPIEEVVI